MESNKITDSDENKIAQVEHNLCSWVKIENAPAWTIEERMNYYGINGLSVAVIKDYKLAWAKAYGYADTAEHRKATVNTLFQAGSISKSLNAVGIFKLIREKKLDLYADINSYLKSWKFPYDQKSKNKKITLANLLSHTAGLNLEEGFPGYEQGAAIPTIIQVLDGKSPANNKAIRSEFEPGMKYQYSGGGTMIAQLVIMDITQQPYDEYMYKNILEPLGMKNSFFTQPPPLAQKGNLATAYHVGERTGKYNIYPEQAAAGLWSNPTDLCSYIIETQLELDGRSGKMLSPELARIRLNPCIDSIAPGVGGAYGAVIVSKGPGKYFVHGGGTKGFSALYFGSLAGGNGIVVMCNSSSKAILTEIINSVATVYEWKGFYQPVIRKNASPAPEVLKTYEGSYTEGEDTLVITGKSGRLFIDLAESSCEMHFTSDSTFFVYEEYLVDYCFEKNNKGKITGYSKQMNFPEVVKHKGNKITRTQGVF